jgi:hypothetical protein
MLRCAVIMAVPLAGSVPLSPTAHSYKEDMCSNYGCELAVTALLIHPTAKTFTCVPNLTGTRRSASFMEPTAMMMSAGAMIWHYHILTSSVQFRAVILRCAVIMDVK